MAVLLAVRLRTHGFGSGADLAPLVAFADQAAA
jgi:hypothetical protein